MTYRTFLAAISLASSFAMSLSCTHKEVAANSSAGATAVVQASTKKSSVIPDYREFPVNEKINPCDNFFQYACSSVIDSFQMREDRSRHTFAFDDSNERILEFKKKYFLSLANSKPNSERETQLKNVYSACMNEKSRADEEKDLVKDLKAKLASLKTREDVLSFFQSKYMSGEISLLEFGDVANQSNPLKNDMYVTYNLLSYPEKSYYEKSENTEDLQALITDFFKTIEMDQPEQSAKNILAFETEFSKIYPTPVEWRELFSSPASISRKDLLAKYPTFRLENLLKQIPATTVIRDFEPKSFEFVNKKFNELSVEDLKRLYAYHALSSYLDDAYPEFFKKRFDFAFKHLGGPKLRPERQERCTTLVMRKYSKELDSILWPRLFKNFPKQRVVALGERIRKSILASLKNNQWLSKTAKDEATKKIKSMKLQLVSPSNNEEWDFNLLVKYSDNKPIENARKLLKVVEDKTLANYKKLQSPYRWEWGPLIVNAYYSVEYNKFVLPVGILQPPFFDPKLSDEENLGGLGTVIGHEMGHSIDDQGAKFNSKGILKSWRSADDTKEFEKRTAILVHQFGNAGHNGKLTLGENIGDNVGLTASFQAASTNPQFDSATRKKFFLQYAHLWCSLYRPSFEEQQLKTNPHALGWARTNEQIKQQTSFKEAFQCKEGDKMVLPPEKIVHIW